MFSIYRKIWHSEKYFLAAIFLFGFLIRAGYVWTLQDKWYFYDTRHYERAALNLLKTGSFGEGYLYDKTGGMAYSLEPIYPIFLASIYKIFGHSFLAVRMIQALLGALLLLIIYGIAKQIYPSKNIPKIASILAIFYPYLVFVSGLLYVTLLFTIILSALVYLILLFHKKPTFLKAIAIGFLIGLSIFCRPIIIFFIPFWILWEILYWKKSFFKLAAYFVLEGTVFFLVILPWEWRNYKIFHRITPIRAYQGEVNRLDRQFQLTELKVGKFAGDMLKAVVHSDSLGNHFYIYYNNIYKGELIDSTKQINPKRYYSGIYLRGNRKNEVSTFEAVCAQPQDTLKCRTNFREEFKAEDWFFSSGIRLTKGELLGDSLDNWGNFAVCKRIKNPKTASLVWGKDVNGYGVQEGGLFLLVNSASDSASGYLIVRKPTGYLSLWLIKNGMPEKGIQYKAELNSPFVQKGLFAKMLNLAIKTPRAFFVSYFSEFLKFWSPIITESIDSKNSFNSKSIKLIGEISYGILLILASLALLRISKEQNKEKIILLFLVILAFATGYSIFGVRTRYRIPSDPYLIILASAGVAYIASRIMRRWEHHYE